MITFFDIPSKLPGNAWSPVNWRIRFVLNYKKLAYKTEWIEYSDIESFCKKHNIPPAGKKPHDGTPLYTLPAIHDDKTGMYLADSIPIVQYLDKTYPDTPAAIPEGTDALAHVFSDTFMAKLVAVFPMMVTKMASILNPVSEEYFIRTRSVYFGKPLADVPPTGEARVEAMKKWEQNFKEIVVWYEKSTGKFIIGNKPTYFDFIVGAAVIGFRDVFGEESEEWKIFTGWHNGWWTRFLNELKDYETVV